LGFGYCPLICLCVSSGLLGGCFAEVAQDIGSVISSIEKLSECLFLPITQNIIKENLTADAYLKLIKQIVVNFVAVSPSGGVPALEVTTAVKVTAWP
jgi:hypothetical protein